MTLSLISAVAENGIIGKDGDLPWRLPEDMKFFKNTTMGHPVIMGRKTFETLPEPLDGRTNIVLTRDKTYRAPGCRVVHSLGDAIKEAKASPGSDEIFVVGGSGVYAAALKRADRLYITEVHASPEGDTSFPDVDFSEWKEVSRDDRTKDDRHAHNYSFVVYERI